MNSKEGGSFYISAELAAQVDAYRAAQAQALTEWARFSTQTPEERAARQAEARAQKLARWRQVRAKCPRVPATLEAVCETLDITPEQAEHFSQPYCTCTDPLDSEYCNTCEYYTLDLNPPQED